MGTLEELSMCVALQEAVWGPGFEERVPISILRVARRLGGVVAAAFDHDERVVGFVFGLTGLEQGEPVHWSDMLAVAVGMRDRGVGIRLKRFQRERCLAAGVRRMYWTYDPLEARNGWVNFGRLGGVAREYVREMYGTSASPLHEGLGTDRVVVLWRLDGPRVEGRLAEREHPPGSADVLELPRAFAVGDAGGLPRPGNVVAVPPGDGSILVPVPRDIQELKARDPVLALEWRLAVRSALEAGLAGGREVRELVRGPGSVAHLLMARRSEG